jgi:hypothetical protein
MTKFIESTKVDHPVILPILEVDVFLILDFNIEIIYNEEHFPIFVISLDIADFYISEFILV